MRLRILALTFAGLAIATGAGAASTWFGPELAFPVVARDVGDSQLGIDAGVTVHSMRGSYVGIGADLVYHYWPASPGYKAAFDRYLERRRFQVIDSPTWAFSAVQLTAHVKLVAPEIRRHSPWVKLGAGIYRLDRNLAGPNWDRVYAYVVGGNQSNIQAVLGWYGSVGFDFRTGSNMALGLRTDYHSVRSENEDAPSFSAFTVGTHILFGR